MIREHDALFIGSEGVMVTRVLSQDPPHIEWINPVTGRKGETKYPHGFPIGVRTGMTYLRSECWCCGEEIVRRVGHAALTAAWGIDYSCTACDVTWSEEAKEW